MTVEGENLVYLKPDSKEEESGAVGEAKASQTKAERLELLKKQIEQGSYQVDAEKVAEAFLDSVGEEELIEGVLESSLK